MSNEQSSKPKPSHRVYAVIGDGEDAVWRPIGAAWRNRDDRGYSIELDAFPLNGRMTMRLPQVQPGKESRS